MTVFAAVDGNVRRKSKLELCGVLVVAVFDFKQVLTGVQLQRGR